ncbi:cysteine desulfurase sulfur acceptor subunit CsdE [Providencia sp. wls1943]|jgi:cysteine desulfuration protein SufE|uniref:Cysteine desulfurase sulfur acceptor subunit CsdE n=1 Tax=Providencia zhijiangensis TaxID=3053982 RepID=A0ABZ0MZL3_9GAMM|nr:MULTISPECIES: cysteine desulfurase sulfur acceptor subunit CsdE [Providencia]MTC75021.1 cysteine desulfurase sulfur acceptor subunit CsdE [Providencia sp. wls1919]MTB66718.1 cysteine desulfurase sulfur acceptor subunit CsdE [Providencia sp. wls1943]MTC71037.1 cysteine desulfurase sulfur acceptor subunit CsdE [Providencia sp. wls1914]QLR04179.1 cysteine desulfurase sulfur acceptor subunit CsdE [Providencia rettgeri]WPA91539.1 cysteine desulfurase sulfur acceptor subunit CsdE [Providencia sp.
MTLSRHELASHPFGTEIVIHEIVEQFSKQKAWEDKYRLLIQLAKKLPSLTEEEKQQTQEVHGCENRVWIGAILNDDDTFHFYGDSEGRVVKGLFAILLACVEQKNAQQILATDFDEIFSQTGLSGQLSESRQNGIHALITAIKNIAGEMTPAE